MDPTYIGLLAFLAASVLVAFVMLWPRFRDALLPERKVEREAIDAALRAIDRSPVAQDIVADALRVALLNDASRVRATRDVWIIRLREASDSPIDEVEQALDAL